MIFILSSELIPYFNQDANGFHQAMTCQGEVYRQLEGRCTQRIALGNQQYFIKQHHGVGWKEIFKNILFGRWPVLSAKNEWLAIHRLRQLSINVPEVVAFGQKGKNPAAQESFIITKALPKSISLEQYFKTWKMHPPSFKIKRQLIEEVARMTRIMHDHGVNHRDLYSCHFLMDLRQFLSAQTIKLYLIDLHRAQIRKKVPLRWRIKDLAGLYFSTKICGLRKQDYFRFLKAYFAKPLTQVFQQQTLWEKAKQRGEKLYQKHGQTP